MTIFLVLTALLVLAAVVWTLVDVHRDGYRARPTRHAGASPFRDDGARVD
ncbi:hypothetical protein [Labedella endophytica]|nr:hypothetical protein [Labedella endophytica]